MTVVLDPTAELRPNKRERVARPESLNGLTVGLLDISKPPWRHLSQSCGGEADRPWRQRQALQKAHVHQAGTGRPVP